MKKKIYQSPATDIIISNATLPLLQGSINEITNTAGNADINYGGGGNGGARTGQTTLWDEEEEDNGLW